MDSSFRIERRDEGDVVLLEVAGFLDDTTVSPFDAAVHRTLTSGRTRIVLDLSRVSYVNSSALGVILDARDQARGRGGDVRLCGVQPGVRKALEMLSFGQLFEIHLDAAAAIASFAPRGGG